MNSFHLPINITRLFKERIMPTGIYPRNPNSKVYGDRRKPHEHKVRITFEDGNKRLSDMGLHIRFTDKSKWNGVAKKTPAICDDCGYDWEDQGGVRPAVFFGTRKPSTGCPNCSIIKNKLTFTDANLRLEKKKSPVRFIDEKNWKGTRFMALARCLECGYEWMVRASNPLNQDSECPSCSGQLPHTTELVKEKIKNRPIELLDEIVSASIKVHWRCKNCGYEWEATSTSVIFGSGCPQCGGKLPLTTEIVKERIKNRPLELLDEIKNNHDKVHWRCKDCGKIWEAMTSNVIYRGSNCPYCCRSFNEKLTRQYLLELIPEFCQDPQFWGGYAIEIPNIQTITPDFKLIVDDKIVLVEYNGIQHYEPTDFNSHGMDEATKNFTEYQLPRDAAEREWCKKNNIPLFEIDGRKYKGEKIRQYIIDHIIPHLKS